MHFLSYIASDSSTCFTSTTGGWSSSSSSLLPSAPFESVVVVVAVVLAPRPPAPKLNPPPVPNPPPGVPKTGLGREDCCAASPKEKGAVELTGLSLVLKENGALELEVFGLPKAACPNGLGSGLAPESEIGTGRVLEELFS